MKNVISNVSDVGLTKDKEYEVLEESNDYYKVVLDNGNKSYRRSDLFREQNK